MSRAQLHKPHHPNDDVPDGTEPGSPPVEPDEGPVPAHIPDDPEHERNLVPDANPTGPVAPQAAGRHTLKLPRRAKAPGSPAGLPLPHERDESPNASTVPDPMMVQAKRDIDAGLVDTDIRATPSLDAKRRAHLVPGPGGKPSSTDT